MRRLLLPIALLLVLAALAYFFLNGPTPVTPDAPDAPIAAASGEPLQPGRIERSDAAAAAAEAAAFDPRGLKTGVGSYGLHGTVVDERGEPVPGAWVAAYSGPYPLFDFEVSLEEILEKPLDFDLEPLASTRADAAGHFELAGVPGRSLYLVARTSKRLTRGRQPVKPEEVGSEQGVLLHTIAGGDLAGRVVNEFGAPVANAEVFVLPSLTYLVQAVRTREIYLERVFSGGDGSFRVDAVPAGAVLTVQAFDGATHPGSRDFGPLAAGASAQIEVRLAATGSLTARAVDDEQQPVGGARAVAVPLDLRLLPAFARDLPAWIAESGAGGELRWPRLPRRNYLLLAQSRDGRSAPYAAAVQGDGSTAPEALVVQTSSAVDGRLVDAEGRGIVGAKVMLASIPTKPGADGGGAARRGREGGMPGGAEMFLEAAKEILPLFLPAETWATTGANGRFRLPVWQDARLTVELEGFPRTTYELPELGERKPVLVLAPPGAIEGSVSGPDAAPVRFFVVNADLRRSILEPEVEDVERFEGEDGRSFSQRRNAARETARQAVLGDALAEDEVAVLPEETRFGELLNTRLMDDGTGRFRIENLMPGTYRVEARASGWVVARSEEIEVPPGGLVQDVQITLQRGGTIRGRVIAAGTREPVAGALVWAGQGDESGFTGMMFAVAETLAMDRTGADGGFELLGVEPGADRIHATAEGYANTMIKGKSFVEGDVREGLVIEMNGGGTIQGSVFDRHGLPLPARMVGGFAMDSKDFFQVPTDELGQYVARNVKPGNYFLVSAALDDEALFTGDFLGVLGGARIAQAYVKQGQTVTVDITDPSAGGCKVTGRVVLPDGRAIADAALFAMAAEASIMDLRFATARADAEGNFAFRALAPGKYRLSVESADWRGSVDMDVPDLPEVQLTLEAPDGSVSGQVVSAQTGQPVTNATVSLTREDSAMGFLGAFMPGGKQSEWEQTDEEGRFRFGGVAAGRYSIEVQADSPWGRNRDEDSALAEPLGRLAVPEFAMGLNDRKDLGTLRLPISSAVLVRVTSEGKEMREGFSVRAIPDDSAAEDRQSYGWNGEARVSGLEPGGYELVVEARGYATARLRGVQVPDAQTVEVSVDLTPGVGLAARVTDQNGQALPEAALEVLDATGQRVDNLEGRAGLFAGFFNREDGAMPLGSYAPGNYRVRATWQERTQERTVTLSPGTEEDQVVEFSFPR
jgi:protocatechuate 3,4-dioxygenase beta subunit